MFDELCYKIFGVEREKQEKKLILMLVISLIAFAIAFMAGLDVAYVIIFLVWGWNALRACVGITQLSSLFQYNIVAILIAIILWLAVGMYAGVVVFLIGIIRVIQLEVEKYQNKMEK